MREKGRRAHQRNVLFSVCGKRKLDTWQSGKHIVDIRGQQFPPTQCAKLEALPITLRLSLWSQPPEEGKETSCLRSQHLGNTPLPSFGGTLFFSSGCGDGVKNRTRPLSGGFFVEEDQLDSEGKIDKEQWGQVGHSLQYSIEVKSTNSDTRLTEFKS